MYSPMNAIKSLQPIQGLKRIEPLQSMEYEDLTRAKWGDYLVRTNSLETLYHSRANVPSRFLSVIKITNLHWETCYEDLVQVLKPFNDIPLGHQSPHFSHGVHLLMHPKTSRPMADCFIEIEPRQARSFLNKITQKPVSVHGRQLGFHQSHQKELIESFFPEWDGTITANGIFLKNGTDSSTFVDRQYISVLLMACRNTKATRKYCWERPFDFVISILTKMPWHQYEMITTMQRDHLFECNPCNVVTKCS